MNRYETNHVVFNRVTLRNMLINGDTLGADTIIFDLEDAVSPDEKDAARILVRNALKYQSFPDCEVVVRINPTDTEFWKEDLKAIIPLKPDVIMPTKVSGKEMICQVADFMTQVEKEKWYGRRNSENSSIN